MTDIARRTIEELVVRYELEPTLDDVFVEGAFDRDVIASALGHEGVRRAIYEVVTVEVPSSLLADHGLTEGNKQRVIALARELAKIEGDCSYVCLVDKDLDHWFGELEATKRLRWSKYCDIELHFLSADFLKDLLVVTCKAHISDFDAFFEALTSTLSDLYAMRLADRKLSLNLRWIPFESCLSHRGGVVSLSMEDYVDRLLTANGKGKEKEKFQNEVAQFRIFLSGYDCRDHIRGHDFVDMLAWVIRRFRGVKELASNVAMQRFLVFHARSMPAIVEGI